MDIFGIGVRIKNSVHEHARLARGTGRSYVLSDLVQDHDVVIFSRLELAQEFRKLQADRKRTQLYTSVILDPTAFYDQADMKMIQIKGVKTGRLFFDHVWLEEYYAAQVGKSLNDLVRFSKRYGKDEI